MGNQVKTTQFCSNLLQSPLLLLGNQPLSTFRLSLRATQGDSNGLRARQPRRIAAYRRRSPALGKWQRSSGTVRLGFIANDLAPDDLMRALSTPGASCNLFSRTHFKVPSQQYSRQDAGTHTQILVDWPHMLLSGRFGHLCQHARWISFLGCSVPNPQSAVTNHSHCRKGSHHNHKDLADRL